MRIASANVATVGAKMSAAPNQARRRSSGRASLRAPAQGTGRKPAQGTGQLSGGPSQPNEGAQGTGQIFRPPSLPRSESPHILTHARRQPHPQPRDRPASRHHRPHGDRVRPFGVRRAPPRLPHLHAWRPGQSSAKKGVAKKVPIAGAGNSFLPPIFLPNGLVVCSQSPTKADGHKKGATKH